MKRITFYAPFMAVMILITGCSNPGFKARKWVLPKETLPSQTQIDTPKEVKTLLKEPSASSREEASPTNERAGRYAGRTKGEPNNPSAKPASPSDDSANVERAVQWDREASNSSPVALASGEDMDEERALSVRQASAGSAYARQQLADRTRQLIDEVRSRAPDRVPTLLEDIRQGASHGTWPDVLQAWELSMDMAPASVPSSSPARGADSLTKRIERARQKMHEPPTTSDFAVDTRFQPPEEMTAASENAREPRVEGVMTLSHPLRSSEGGARRLPYRQASTSGPTEESALPINVDFQAWANALETQASQNPDAAAEWEAYSRLIHAMAGEGSRALETVSKFDSTQQRFWKNYTFALMRYFDDLGLAKPEQRAAAAGAALRDSMDALAELSNLEITDPLFCKSVASFGNYVEFPSPEFKAGDGVVIYWEARHFTSTDSPDGYRTRMRASFDILDANGSVVHSFEQRFKDDVCRRKRTDYFNVVVFEWPKTLTPGKYTLKVRVTDNISEKWCERSRDFEIRP